MGLILDTSALITLERDPNLWRSGVIHPEEAIALPAIVWAEALVGVRLADSGRRAARRMARLQAIRNHTKVYPFNDHVAEHYADIFAELHAAGTLIPQNDMQVAATARALDFGVLLGAADEAHFRRVKGLKITVLR